MIRQVTPHDSQAITEIYNHYVLHTTISFEIAPLSVQEMKERILHISTRYPYWVYEEEGRILGYCYAHEWKERPAYRHTWETTVYLDKDCTRRGIGLKLMRHLIESCKTEGAHSLIACITDCNERSKRFHIGLGFRQVSLFREVGEKFGTWLDVADFELLLTP